MWVFKLLWAVLKHKWFVFIAGRVCGVSLYRLIIHDWSKLSPTEFAGYGRNFYGGPYPTKEEDARACMLAGAGGARTKESVEDDFQVAWLHHQHLNPHHWQYWCQVNFEPAATDNSPPPDSGCAVARRMPTKFIREMVADWWAAGRSYDDQWRLPEWYEKNRDNIILHRETRAKVEMLICESAKRLMRDSIVCVCVVEFGRDPEEQCHFCGK